MTILTSSLLMIAAAGSPSAACADPTTQADMNRCAGLDYEAADAELNRQWRITNDYMKAADASSRGMRGRTYAAVLLDAQRAWLKYRDTHCVSAGYQARGGSMQPMLVSMCRTRLTQERIEQLKQLTREGG
ncbi:DUF1311 domain-containing protein [Altererythrobacter xixiisoli]|uniref:DUF1311 domain-containing protein n=1 Tax=Croceibacterium xixiisoli TaxID=1476466 RepID=A0A6I4TX13_9SPHN|nr:lysozyme inhibitor LprI family protein [Croceibacterium xixiisoli]MXO99188.1 DUF1311 domain-containing protein [Croceibacterium xixiisoli]